MPSLFRIDSHSLTADNMKPSGVVELPGFEDMVEHHGGEALHAAAAQVADAEGAEAAPVVSAEEEARRIKQKELQILQQQIDQAKGQAQRILDDANVQAKNLLEEAQQKGYADGYAQATAAVKGEQVKDHQLVEDSIATLKNARDDIFAQVENSVLDLSLYIAEYIIKMKMNENDEVFINIVRNTLSKVKYQNNIIVNVSRVEFERLFADPNSEIVKERGHSGVTVKQDLSLKSGECMVETEFGNINSGIKTQLKRLGYALEDGTSE